MPEPIRGIHHITAVAGDPQRNLDFYTRVLGLRLVKLTVNFDDPGTYHFYFGDAAGRPGSILTFFPWQNIRRGRRGTGQVGTVSFEIPQNSIGFWSDHLKRQGLSVSGPYPRFDGEALAFLDPDGLQLELTSAAPRNAAGLDWPEASVPSEHAILGFGPPVLLIEGFEVTARLLTEVFGMRAADTSQACYRFTAGDGSEIGASVDIEVSPEEPIGGMGSGVVHHIAWRTKDDAEQLEWRKLLIERGLDVTPVMDRQYFHSIYFREPGRILFEIATDPPGFATDETPETLGSGLRLPPWLEAQRAAIEQILPPLQLPQRQGSHGS